MRKLQTILLLTSLSTVGQLTACGNDTEFEGPSAKKSADLVISPAPTPAPPPDPAPPAPGAPAPVIPPPPSGDPAYKRLNWFWQCESDPTSVPKAADDSSLVLQGVGPHRFDPDQVSGTKVTLSGRLCPPAALKRDIVFVIDTSGSMGQNDPRTGSNCGRLAAVRQVLLALPGGAANFGVVTFNSDLDRTSSRLYDNVNLLFTELAGVGDIADVICNIEGGTNYEAGLTRASALLAAGRADAAKEIYFVSDGQPDSGKEGIQVATQLKSIGVYSGTTAAPVTIATIMLAGNDEIMSTQIASRDAKTGAPLHAFVAQVSGLAKAFDGLASNEIVSAKLEYRAVGSSKWLAVDLLTRLDAQFNFTLPSINIDLSKEPEGLEVRYEYRDRRDHVFESGGKLLWTVEDVLPPVADELPPP